MKTSGPLAPGFLQGGGEMGKLIRSKDWSDSSIGLPDTWPQTLRITIGILLNSRFPMFLWWGPDLICFYNDAYRPSLGDRGKHPAILGMNAEQAWPEIWHIIQPLINDVMQDGKSVWKEDQLIPIYRNEKIEDVYWTFSYSPVNDEEGITNGVLVTCTETTDKILGAKRNILSEQKFRDTVNQAPVGICILRGNNFIVEMANKAYLELIDKSEYNLVGTPLFNAIPEVADAVVPFLNEVLKTGKPYYGTEFPIYINRHGRKELSYFNFVYQPFIESDNIVSGVIVVANEITVMVEGKHALGESERQFRKMVTESPVPMTIFRTNDFVIEMANTEMFKNIWRKDEKEVIGKKLVDVFPELLHQKYPELLRKVFTTGKPYRENESLAEVQGDNGLKRFYLDYEYAPLFETDGTVSGLMVTVNDVTEKVQARQEVEETAQRLSMAIESTHLGTWDYNPLTGKLEWSDECRKIYGVPDGVIIDFPLFDEHIYADDKEFVQQAIQEAMVAGTGGSYDITYRILRFDNRTIRWIRSQGKVKFNELGKAMRFIGTVVDITDQKQSQKALEESEQRTRLAVEAAEMGTFDWDLITQIFIGSPRLNHIFGYLGLSNVTHEHLLNAFVPEDRLIRDQSVADSVAKGSMNYEARIVWPDKSIHWVKVYGKVMYDEKMKPMRMYGTVLDFTEEKITILALEQSQSRLSIAIEAAELGAWELNLKNDKANYSDRYLEILGFEKDQTPGQQELILKVHPADLPGRTESFKMALSSGLMDHEIRIVPAPGNIRWIKSKGKVFYDKDGKPDRMLGTIVDITDQKMAFETLQESEARFKVVADTAPVMIWLAGTDKLCYFFNKGWLNFTGRTLEQEEGNGWADGVHPEDFQRCLDIYLANFDARKEFYMEYRLRHYDGEFRWISNRGVPRYSTDGTFMGYIGGCMDIQDQKSFNEKLQKSELLFKTISNASPVGLWMTGKNAGNTFVNDTWIGWTGIPLEEQYGFGWLDRVIDEDKLTAPEKFREAMSKKEKFTAEFRIIRVDGKLRWCLTEGSPYFDLNGDYAGYAGSVTDITDRKMIEEELENKVKERTSELNLANTALEKSNGELEQFAYVASHDLQEPLRKIKTFISRLQETNEGKVTAQSELYMEKIISASGRMSDLIRDLLEYSRTAKIGEEQVNTDLNITLKNVLEDFELLINQKEATIQIDPLPVIECVPHQMTQLFSNLINNSLKFAMEGRAPVISISSKKLTKIELTDYPLLGDGDYCEIILEDNGIGFNNEFAEKIFEIFQRLNARSSYAGSGIGLSICRKIVVNHHGLIFADSVEEVGTTFHIILPVSQPVEA